jgi:nicotinate-nucleotide pyrophosphorylase (carboxylating)
MTIEPTPDHYNSIVDQALAEDLGQEGDVTSRAIFSPDDGASAIIKSKDSGVLCGMFILKPLFEKIDPHIILDPRLTDGDQLSPGREICILRGAIVSILAGERVALNFLQRLSGIATQTSRMVAACRGTHAVILDTRKTTPLLRSIEKRAVVVGGGANHRFGLYDMVLIKDTHVKAAGGVVPAIRKAQAFRSGRREMKIEVEVQSEREFLQAVDCNPDRIMLDNMDCGSMRRCAQYIQAHRLPIELEASGNVSEKTVRFIAETGVNFISVGSLTHSVTALDIHLVIV